MECAGFATAAGKKVDIDPKKLERAAQLLGISDEAVSGDAPTAAHAASDSASAPQESASMHISFASAAGRPVAINPERLRQAQQLFSSSDVPTPAPPPATHASAAPPRPSSAEGSRARDGAAASPSASTPAQAPRGLAAQGGRAASPAPLSTPASEAAPGPSCGSVARVLKVRASGQRTLHGRGFASPRATTKFVSPLSKLTLHKVPNMLISANVRHSG